MKLALPSPQEILERVRLGWDRINNRSYLRTTAPDKIDRTLAKHNSPFIRPTLISCSLDEDEQNPFYTGVLNTLSIIVVVQYLFLFVL